AQHVAMWIGQNDRAAVWVNGRCVHRGDYASSGKYDDANQVDQIASFATLDAGWNRIEVAVEGWPAPRDKGWGLSIRLATFDGRPIPGLRFSVDPPSADVAPDYTAPEANKDYYSWTRCETAFHELMPMLTEADLQAFTGLRGLRVTGEVSGADGMIAVQVPGHPEGPEYRDVSSTWDSARDRDVRLNNGMDWAREAT